MKISWVITLMVPLVFPVGADARTPEERARMIREFEEANRAEQEKIRQKAVEKKAPEEQGLEPLREDLTSARSAFLREKSSENRARVENATLLFVEPMVRLRRFDEAVAQIDLSLELIGRQPALLERVVGIRFEQAGIALSQSDFSTAVPILEKAAAVAKGANLGELQGTVNLALRDVYFDWAQDLFLKGDWRRANEKAQQALLGGIEPHPILAFLARISYLANDYSKALKELNSALSGDYRESPEFLRFAEVLKHESYLERSYRRITKENFQLSTPSGLVVNDRALDAAFSTARREAARMFGAEIPFKVPVSVYPRTEFFQFCQSPQWRGAASMEGKLRLRADVLKGGRNDLEKVALYSFGLWVADTLSSGRAPAWLQEGFAHQLALPTGPPNSALGTLRRVTSQGRYPSFTDLEVSLNVYQDIGEAAQAMAQAQTAVQLIIEKKGLGAVVQLLGECRYAANPEDAMKEILGYDYASFSNAWSLAMQSGFATKSFTDQAGLRSLGIVSPLGSYWNQ